MNKNTLKKIIILLAITLLTSVVANIILFSKVNKKVQEQTIEQVELELNLQALAEDKEIVLNQIQNDEIAIKQAQNEIDRLKRKCAYSLAGAGVDYE